MRKHFLSLCASLLTALCALATPPNEAVVKGTVTDAAKQPLGQATVVLHRLSDSTLVRTAITDKDGRFELSGLLKGEYFLKASATGHAEYVSGAISLTPGDQHTVGTISLQAQSKELQGVTVTARRPLIEIKADKTIFNVENSITGQGSDALELLTKTPGIQVDNNENISMKGKTGVRVYVDGRMMQLDTKDLAAYLRSINSNDIEAIEMISNPSARYDASGNAGIINIRLKKNKKYGTNGSVNLGLVQGITPKGNGSLNLNNRNKKLNLFGNVGGSIGNYATDMTLYRIQNDTLYDQRSLNISRTRAVNAKIGADWYASSRQTFGVLATINHNDGPWSASSTTPIYDNKTGQLASTLIASNRIPGSRTNANFNANYRFADTSGFELNIDADYGLFRGVGRSLQPNRYLRPNGALDREVIFGNHTPTDINIYTFKADVEQKKWGGKLGYGTKFSYVKTDNAFNFFDYQNGQPVLNTGRSNQFSYTENVNAAYANYQRQLSEKWSLQAGLRLEQTNSDGQLTRADGQKQDDDRVKRNYLDWFPSAALTWNFNKNNTLNLTYSRRIDRPTYQDLNPFENKLDELTYEKGNAFLQPQYTDNVELSHTFKGFLTTTVGYSYVKDFATQITDTTDGKATYIQQRNLASQQIINFSVGAPLPIAKWWNGYLNLWYNYQIYKGTFNNGRINEQVPTYGVYMQNTFNLSKKGLKAEMTGWFNGPSVWAGTWRIRPMGNLDIGVMQPLFKNKASIKLSMTDVFRTNFWRSTNNFGGVYIRGRGQWEAQTVRINFTWRFGSNEVKSARQRKTGLESEASRIKN